MVDNDHEEIDTNEELQMHAVARDDEDDNMRKDHEALIDRSIEVPIELSYGSEPIR